MTGYDTWKSSHAILVRVQEATGSVFEPLRFRMFENDIFPGQLETSRTLRRNLILKNTIFAVLGKS